VVLESDCWRIFDEARHGKEWTFGAFSGQALSLFAVTDPTADKIFTPDAPEDYATIVLSEVATSYAMLCRDWKDYEPAFLPLYSRGAAAAVIRLGALDVWLSKHGHDCHTDEESSFGYTISVNPVSVLEEYTDQAAASVAAKILHTYSDILEARVSTHGRQFLVERRRQITGQLMYLRQWAAAITQKWQIGASSAPDVIPPVLAYIARGLFVAAWSERFDQEIFPTREYLAQLCRDGSTTEWFAAHNVVLPSWATPEHQ
jgi:hypothetical protein